MNKVMKNLTITLLTFFMLQTSWAEEELVCGMSYPPPINFKHNHIDNYLFTFGEMDTYSRGGRIDPSCFNQYVLVTKLIKDKRRRDRLIIREPWFKQEVVYEVSGLQNFALKKILTVKKENYAIFTANTFGNLSSQVLVFLTHPEFKKVFSQHGYLDEKKITEDGFILTERVSGEDANLCERTSTATWPYQSSKYKFADKSYAKEILKKPECAG